MKTTWPSPSLSWILRKPIQQAFPGNDNDVAEVVVTLRNGDTIKTGRTAP